MIQLINSPFGDNNLVYLTYGEWKLCKYVEKSTNIFPVNSVFSIRFLFKVSLGLSFFFSCVCDK